MIDENMVERVARALYDDWVREEGDRGEEYCSWDQLPDKDTWRPRARAVLEAMREPTSQMLSAGMRAADDALDSDWDSGGDGESHNSYSYLRSDAPALIWKAMLDSAAGPIPIVDMKDLG